MNVLGSDYLQHLEKHVDPSNLPTFLGGSNTTSLLEDPGPWNDFEVVDWRNEGDIVGVRRRGMAPAEG